MDGATSERGSALARLPGWKQVDASRIDLCKADFAIQGFTGFHHRRQLSDGQLLFVVNTRLEPIYLLGDFALEAVERGFTIVPGSRLNLGPWKQQGHPFYSEGIAYTEKFNIGGPAGRHLVSLRRWYGSVARVAVNEKAAGLIYSAPWSLDVTRWMNPGLNDIEVTVVGTLKNTLGPHHGQPALGTAWPAMFQKGIQPGPPPGNDYSTVGYGLFEPFSLTVEP